MTPSSIFTWVQTACPGDAITYARGHYFGLRAVPVELEFAWRLYELGMVELVQRRRGEDDYEYIAQRT